MRISYTAAQDWRRCQQLYDYSHIQRLVSRVQDPAPTLGRVLHLYLQRYYESPLADPLKAHNDALGLMWQEAGPELRGLASAAYAADQPAIGDELAGLCDKAARIAGRYYLVRGRLDWDEHTALHVEQKFEYPLDANITTPVRLDLITEDRDGMHWLWEHKSGKEIPEPVRRLTDLQTMLYAAIAEEVLGIHIDGVVWNHIRSKEPTIPALLKRPSPQHAKPRDGYLSKAADMDTTWEAYLQQIELHGLDVADYEDLEPRLGDREETVFFPRYAMPIMATERVLLRDFVATSRTINAVYTSGATFVPVRTIGRQCDWCPMRKLCEAVIMGGDDGDLIQRLFKRKEEHGDTIAAATAASGGWGDEL